MQVDGVWKLGDFSLVAARGPQGSEQFVVDPNSVGTGGYRSPEQITLSHFNDKVDIWAMGCILNELVTGKALFANDYAIAGPSGYAEKAASAVEAADVIQPLSAQLSTCVSAFKNWKEKTQIKQSLLQMFAVSPEDRPAASDIIQDALQRLIDIRAPSVRTDSGLT
jgi:serine/threonine protein kinase